MENPQDLKNELRSLISTVHSLGALPLSYSKVKCLSSCPAQYKLKYVDKTEGEKVVDSPVLIVGRAVHKLFETCLKTGARAGYSPDTVDFDRIWQQSLATEKLTHEETQIALKHRANSEDLLIRIYLTIKNLRLHVTPEAWFTLDLEGNVRRDGYNIPKDQKVWNGVLDFFGKNTTAALMLDYKTHGYNEWRYRELQDQLRLYSFFKMLMYPDIQILRTGAVYIADNDIRLGDPILREDFAGLFSFFKDYVLEYIRQLKNALDAGFPATKSKACDWCSYKAFCPLMK